MDYNVRKLVVLSAVYELGEATSADVWDAMNDDVSLCAIGMSLLRYHRQGLLNRRGGKEKIYEITEKGVERLEWLERFDEEDENEKEEDEEDNGKAEETHIADHFNNQLNTEDEIQYVDKYEED